LRNGNANESWCFTVRGDRIILPTVTSVPSGWTVNVYYYRKINGVSSQVSRIHRTACACLDKLRLTLLGAQPFSNDEREAGVFFPDQIRRRTNNFLQIRVDAREAS
jgi:hypothetical protein